MNYQDQYTRQVADGIWMVSTPLGTVSVHVYLVNTGDGFLLYDAGLKCTASSVLTALQNICGDYKKLHTLVISHSHHDHIGAVAEIAEKTGARVFAHALAEPWMVDHQRQFQEFFDTFSRWLEIPETLQTFFFENLGRPWCADSWLRQFPVQLEGPRRIELHSTPGHSADGLSLLLPDEGVVLCGDAFMGAGVGGSLPQYENRRQYLQSLETLMEWRPRVLLTGHFEPLWDAAIEQALDQSKSLVHILHEFIRQTIHKLGREYNTGDLTRLVCARFGRHLVPQAFITVLAHLHDLEREGLVYQEGENWKPGQKPRPLFQIIGVNQISN